MVLFERYINKILISVAYEDELYFCNKEVNDAIFSTFQKSYIDLCNIEDITVGVYFGFQKCYKINAYAIHIHKKDEKGLVLSILHELEFYFAFFLKCVVLHGAAIQVKKTNILLVGERNSGKSTLTNYLLNKFDANYIDDDCIYLFCNKVIGFNLPIRLREGYGGIYNKIYEDVDGDDIKRHLIVPHRCIDGFETIQYVIFPAYNHKYNYEVKHLSKGELYNKIIQNVRNTESVSEVFHSVTKYFQRCEGMVISYSDCDLVCRYLYNLVGEN